LRSTAQATASRDQALAEGVRTELTTLLRDMLEEARHLPLPSPDNVVRLEGQQEPRVRRSDSAH
jgi:hypothetical protein